ncbi:circumsporozoite protein-like [Zingiber officinale]|uniref:circumsporozoite protein-like n=1 Tax=Zingiber officinale TaxID=94328 RepID=UPI001C4C296B|nr:circumsporozoite protein-like [Zingiber officinale]
MMKSVALDMLKLKAAEIEAATAKEAEKLGLAPAGSHEGESEEAQTAGDASAARTATNEAAGETAPSGTQPAIQTEEGGSYGDEIPLSGGGVQEAQGSGGAPPPGPSYAELKADLDKTKRLLEAEQHKSSDLQTVADQLKTEVKTYDKKIEQVNTRKNMAISDLEIKNTKARALAQRVKELTDLLTAEKAGCSAEVIALQGDLKTF